MLVAVVVFSLLLGVVSQPIVEAHRDRTTADALRAAGADVATETVRFPGVSVVRFVLGDWVCQRAGYVRLPRQCAGVEELRHLRRLKSLTSLCLSGTAIDDTGLAHLAGLDALSQLDLRHTQVTDAGLEHLAGLARLDSLDTFGTRVTYAGLARLERRIPRGRFCEMRAREEIGALGGQIDTRSGALVDQGETVFFETALQAYLDGTQLSGDALVHIRYLDTLEEAELVNLALGEEGLGPLAELPMLQVLTLRKTAVDIEALRSVARMKSLHRLSFYDSEITVAELEQLAQFEQLELLELHRTGVTEDAAEPLRRALPGCTIRVSDGD